MALRWGIVSAGLICSDFTTVLRALPRSEHQVVAVAARDLSRAKEFARKHDIPKAYGSYEELAKDPDVEVAYVGTQHPQHKAAVLLCLAAGKAVLCEKPMGVNAAEVREMVAEARARGLFLMEILDPCWCPTELVVKGERKEFPLPPAPGKEFHFTNGAGMTYEARHVRECLRKGLKESPVVPLAESELLADILEEVRKAIGVTFPQDGR
uniref:Trans-1,2-dihydrobenzene-1,2-diol dehydrogenase n=1 Tax=Myotis myotis TaxID=51298 RepID=A0A7J7QXE4_MYOMY|nr:dihydrodiol dehydrogenase [Myotis myotis]